MNQGRGRNHPPQPRQLMHIWGKKEKTRKQKEEQKKEKDWGTENETLYPNPGIDALIGNED